MAGTLPCFFSAGDAQKSAMLHGGTAGASADSGKRCAAANADTASGFRTAGASADSGKRCSAANAFYHRLGLAEEAYEKLRLIWNSPKTRQSKVRLFQAIFLPILLYGLDSLTLTPKMLAKIDGQYYGYLRGAIGIKASYYSRGTNQSVWEQAGKPELLSERLN